MIWHWGRTLTSDNFNYFLKNHNQISLFSFSSERQGHCWGLRRVSAALVVRVCPKPLALDDPCWQLFGRFSTLNQWQLTRERIHSDGLFRWVGKKDERKKKGKAAWVCHCSIHDFTHLAQCPLIFLPHLFTSAICNFVQRYFLSCRAEELDVLNYTKLLTASAFSWKPHRLTPAGNSYQAKWQSERDCLPISGPKCYADHFNSRPSHTCFRGNLQIRWPLCVCRLECLGRALHPAPVSATPFYGREAPVVPSPAPVDGLLPSASVKGGGGEAGHSDGVWGGDGLREEADVGDGEN